MKPTSPRLPLLLATLLVVVVWYGVTMNRRRREPSVLAKLSAVAMAYSPDGQVLATAANDKTIKLWRAQQRLSASQLTDTLPGASDSCEALAFAPDGKILAEAGVDYSDNRAQRSVRMWNIAPRSPQRRLLRVQGDDEIAVLTFSRDGQTLAAAAGNRLVLCNVSSDQSSTRQFLTHHAVTPVRHGRPQPGRHSPASAAYHIIAISPDLRLVALSGDHLVTQLRSAQTGRLVRTLAVACETTGYQSSRGSFSPDGSHLAIGTDDGALTVCSTASGRVIQRLVDPHGPAPIKTISFDRGGERVAVGGGRPCKVAIANDAAIWDVRRGTLIWSYQSAMHELRDPGGNDYAGDVRIAALDPRGTGIAVAHGETISLWPIP